MCPSSPFIPYTLYLHGVNIHYVYLKPRPNGPASSHKWRQVELAKKHKLDGQTDLQVSSQVLASQKKKI